ncbi:MAG: MBL fold metallo-hydrolase [Candidatus Eisenbacteria sp.]|nr:MBL fold metallo-hydrolase [Candidatus Eisenbacteria bacterium]
MKIHFHGAVRSVTGSKHVIETEQSRVLIDCGLFQGRRKDFWEQNQNFPFDPTEIDALILSHAHIDHSGNIPGLVKQGFRQNIFSTTATRNLCAVMLRDSAHIQEQDAEYLNRKRRNKDEEITPLYTSADAEKAMELFVGIHYGRKIPVTPDIAVTFYDAGHVLGSALPVLDVTENGKTRRIAYACDLGRDDLPILKDPYRINDADFMIMESTYGDREHETIDSAAEKLAAIVNRTAARGGKVIIPSFALERTQEILHCLRRLFDKRQIPEIPVYVDSPLAVNVTEIFRIHSEYFDQETMEMLANDQNPFQFPHLTYIRKVEDSKKLHQQRFPSIIISASGMCEAGRILHHLKNNIEDSRNTIVIVGFMAQHTLGRRIAEGRPKVKIFRKEYRLRADVEVMDSFSAHADRSDLIAYAKQASKQSRKFFLVHGEETQALALAGHLRDEGIDEVIVPKLHDTIEV